MAQELISIIVPIYNSEKHIRRCVESILSQTYRRFELLLIDDGSVDSSCVICDNYAKKDERVHVIHKNNEGVGAARNTGLSIAIGDYICFVDSDDYVLPDYLKNLISHINNNVDLVFSFAQLERNGVLETPTYPSFEIDKRHFEELVSKNILNKKTAPWSKLYKNRIIKEHDLTFPEDMPIGEDAVFLFSYVTYCKRISVTHDIDYVYIVTTQNSLTKKRYSVSKELAIYSQIESACRDLRNSLNLRRMQSTTNLQYLEQSYVLRVLDSIYFVENMKFKERIKTIKALPPHILHNMIVGGSFRARVLAAVLNLRMIYLYDFIRFYLAKLNRKLK